MKFAQEAEKRSKGENVEILRKDSKPPTVSFKKGRDDSYKKLHKARFLRAPLAHPKKWFKQVPQKRDHIYKNIRFEFSGAENNLNDRTISSAHDRCVALQLKHFYGDNVSSARPLKEIRRQDEDGVCTITDNQWESPATLQGVQDAIANYGILLHHLWPLDMTALVINKILVKHRWLAQSDSMKTRIDIITLFFNAVLRANSRRAANKEAPLDYSEQDDIMRSTMARYGLVPGLQVQNNPQRRNDRVNPNSRAPAQKPQNRGPLLFNNTRVCFAFNSTDGRDCRSTPTATGCKDNKGVEYAHVCSRFLKDKGKHCFLSHRRKDHV